ncbi:MAG: hypothetical protein QMC78_00970 [Methanocellales archaeon]|nr:hypothetical protein [Methanocellales archaeon]
MAKKGVRKSARKSKRRMVILLIALLLGALFVVITIIGMRSPANVELINLQVGEVEWDAEYNFHSDVTLLIQNTGKRTARDVRVYLYIKDGGGEVEYTGYQYFPDLTALRTESRTLTVGLDAEDRRITGTIIVYWDNNSNVYKF